MTPPESGRAPHTDHVHQLPDEIVEALEQTWDELEPLIRISAKLVPIEREDGDPWAIVLSLDIGHNPPPRELPAAAIFASIDEALPDLMRSTRSCWNQIRREQAAAAAAEKAADQ